MACKALLAAVTAIATTTASIPAGAQFNGKYHVVGATHRYQTGTSSQPGRANDRLRTAGPGNNWSASSQSGQGYRVKVKFPTLPRGKTQSVTSR
jgi:hypothetical protein